MSGVADDFLRRAVDRGSAMVLSLPSAGMLRNHKSRFLATDGHGVWMEADPGEAVLLQSLIASSVPVGVSCKIGHEKLRFVAPILRYEPCFRLQGNRNVCAIQVTHPTKLILQQRRDDYRVRVLQDHEITAQVWQIPEHVHLADRPMARQLLNTELRDLSVGGFGFVAMERGQEPPRVTMGERLRIELTAGETTHLLEGRLVFAMTMNQGATVHCGAAFQNLERNLEGRQKLAWLTRLVGELQRDEVRRNRRSRAG